MKWFQLTILLQSLIWIFFLSCYDDKPLYESVMFFHSLLHARIVHIYMVFLCVFFDGPEAYFSQPPSNCIRYICISFLLYYSVYCFWRFSFSVQPMTSSHLMYDLMVVWAFSLFFRPINQITGTSRMLNGLRYIQTYNITIYYKYYIPFFLQWDYARNLTLAPRQMELCYE